VTAFADPERPISRVINEFYAQTGDYTTMYRRFADLRFAGVASGPGTTAYDALTSLESGVAAFRQGILTTYLPVPPQPWEFTAQDLANLARAWADVLQAKVEGRE
jgi:hypothetical protein